MPRGVPLLVADSPRPVANYGICRFARYVWAMSDDARTAVRTGYSARRKPRWGLIALLVGLHVLAIMGLARIFAPDLTQSVIDEATSLVTVTVRTMEEPEVEPAPDPSPLPDEGAAGEEGREATPREVIAPEPPIRIPNPSPAPRATSTGTENTSGAREQGDGTGAGGDGDGTGSGRGGDGRGGLAVVSGPRHISGAIDSARDFPIPPGGRESRIGQTTTVVFTVGVDGRARNCRVRDASNDPQADAIVCRLVESRLGFEPARNAAGQAVPAQYGWRQEWCRGRC